MKHRIRSFLVAACAGMPSLLSACGAGKPPVDDEVQKLVVRSRESNAALMQGDIPRYNGLVRFSDDFTLMSPFGGKPTRAPSSARMEEIGKFFKNGSHDQELVQAYASPDMIVLAVIEHSRVEVGGLPAQEWALRVTLVYQRNGSEWRLAHRHADPLVAPVSLTQSAALARGER